MTSPCIFCRIADGSIPATIAYQDDAVVAFHDLAPQAPTHVLIIPRAHIATVDDAEGVDGSLLGRILAAARSIAREAGASSSGYRLVVNHGADAGQSVSHLHVHLLAGRRLGWPPG